MKILHLIDSGGLYGAEKMLLALVSEQCGQGLEPMILSAGPLDSDEKPLEAEARRLGLPVIVWRMKTGFNLRAARDIQKWAHGNGYQLLHSHGYKFNILMGLFPKAIRRLPLVSTLHGYVHAPRFSKMSLYELLDRIAVYSSQAVVLVANAMKNELPTGIRKSGKLRVIHNGMDTEALIVSAAEPLVPDLDAFARRHQPLLVGVGRLSREKNFESLIDAFSSFKSECQNAGLIIVGEGCLRRRLEARITHHGLEDAILLPGYCPQVPALLARSDLLVMPSLSEGLPITLLEAMAVGVPIMVSAAGDMPDVLGHGQGGRILAGVEPDAITGELVNFFSSETSPSQQVAWARQRIEQQYSAPAMAGSYWKLYNELGVLE